MRECNDFLLAIFIKSVSRRQRQYNKSAVFKAPNILTQSSFFAFWFSQFVFAVSATTVASGALAEREGVGAYLIYCSFLMTGFIYPIVSHWSWSSSGWLKSGVGESMYSSTTLKVPFLALGV